MSYITTDDLKTFLDEREIEALRRDDESDEVDKTQVGITYAMQYVKDRLAAYDLNVEYAKTGSNRSATLMEIVIHIAIWKLAATFPLVQLDGKRHVFYNEAIDNLKRIAKGELCIDTLTAKAEPIGDASGYWGVSKETENII